MLRRWLLALFTGAAWLGPWTALHAQAPTPYAPSASTASANPTAQPLNLFWYYPYYYFPHNYWPNQGPKWPEPVGSCYQPPPAYMGYPPYREPGWRYEYFEPQLHHRGFHFWLDQF